MSNGPVVWMEARCEGIHEFLPTHQHGDERCHETGPGGFFRSIRRSVKLTKQGGWALIQGEWYCPACRKLKEKELRDERD